MVGRSMLSRRRFLSIPAAAGFTAVGGAAVAARGLRWSRLDSGGGPSARWDHTLAADDTGKQLIVFGGRDGTGTALGDGWLFDLRERSWRPLDASAPSPRFGHAVAVDRTRRRLLLFGGQSDTDFFNDVWSFDFARPSWAQLHDGSGDAPAPRYGLPGAVDADGRLLVSHGFTFEGRFDDTWRFDPATRTWSELTPAPGQPRPLNRCLHEMAWTADGQRLLLFGGCSSGFGPCPQGDLWAFDPTAATWTELAQGTAPAPRTNPSLVSDAKHERAILFGGSTDAGYDAGLWSLATVDDRPVWTQLGVADGPSARASHDAAIARGDMYLFGGIGPDGVLADLWKLALDD